MTTDADDPLAYGYISGWIPIIPYEDHFKNTLNPELAPLTEAFVGNMLRVRNLGMIVPDVAFWMRTVLGVAQVAKARLSLPAEFPGRVRGGHQPSPEFIREYEGAMREFQHQLPSADEAWQDGCDLIKPLINMSPGYAKGMEALMSALLIETWAAVEAFLGDLLISALDLASDPLGHNFLGTEKTLPVDVLRRFNFDISDKMGSALALAQKFNFTSLSTIEKDYKSAFSEHDTTEIFDAFRPEVGHLEAIRNLYAHRSGKIDETFLRRVAKSTIIPKYEIGQELRLDGRMVSHYIGVSVELAMELFSFVDRCVFGYRDIPAVHSNG
jgi:hypothetical protein